MPKSEAGVGVGGRVMRRAVGVWVKRRGSSRPKRRMSRGLVNAGEAGPPPAAKDDKFWVAVDDEVARADKLVVARDWMRSSVGWLGLVGGQPMARA